MTQAEFRELLKESVRIEISTNDYGDGDRYLVVKLVSAEYNSSFDPEVIMEDTVYLPT